MPTMTFKPANSWLDQIESEEQRKDEVVACPECGCRWLETVLVQQYPKHHNYILGQKPVSKASVGFWFFKCPHCGGITEPNLINSIDAARRAYDKLVDHLTGTDVPRGTKV